MRRSKLSSLLATIVMVACGRAGSGGPPDLPGAAAPDWKRTAVVSASPPPALSAEGKPECWKADYAGPGEAHVWACHFPEESSAFEAVQRTRAEANTVKFQEGSMFLLVQWDRASRDEITTLIRAVQKSFATGGKK